MLNFSRQIRRPERIYPLHLRDSNTYSVLKALSAEPEIQSLSGHRTEMTLSRLHLPLLTVFSCIFLISGLPTSLVEDVKDNEVRNIKGKYFRSHF